MNEELEIIDSSWIEEFENLDKEYKDYYTEELSFINTHCIYINSNNEIERIVENKMLLKMPGLISKEELIGFIKHNMFFGPNKYALLYILNFNIHLEPINLKTFLKSKDALSNIGTQFLHSIKNIDTIRLNKSITMFHDLNDLVIIYNVSNKNKLTNDSNGKNITNTLNKTKKIYINSSSFKKTKRNLFKDNMT
jgi:hypothetical protein